METQLETLVRWTKLQILFQKFCDRMKADRRFELEMRRLWRCFPDKPMAAATVMKTRYQQELSPAEAVEVSLWIRAFFSRKTTRRPVTAAEKLAMWDRQRGICPCCNRMMERDMDKNHADHLIPFTYVGDELENNLRLTHAGCNLSKSSTMDYCLKAYLFGL